MTSEHPLKKLLAFDGLAEAERLTGRSYKDDGDNPLGNPDSVTGLGMALMHEHAKIKDAVLTERGDTTFNNKIDRYLDIITSNGFEEVLVTPFEGRYGKDEHMIYARRDGLLLSFDTFGGKSINGGKVYYNWRPSEDAAKADYRFTSSGRYARNGATGPITSADTWIGDHDCREALIFKMDNLAVNGAFVAPWVERPFIWLLHYMDTKTEGYDYKAINEARIALLPAWIREMIGPS